MPPRLQQHGGGEGDEAEDGELLIGVGVREGLGLALGLGLEDGELLEHLLQQLLHGQRRGNQWTLEAAGSST